jgi:hypothetical protein
MLKIAEGFPSVFAGKSQIPFFIVEYFSLLLSFVCICLVCSLLPLVEKLEELVGDGIAHCHLMF